MDKNYLLAQLPAFKGNVDFIVHGNQKTTDILYQVLRAHEQYQADYDCIAAAFMGGNPLLKLFNFCNSELPYQSENGIWQSTRSPAGILLLADTSGVDCKHYSGWIAGVIDALNRTGQYNYNWYYRFCCYNEPENEKKPQPDHVFVVVEANGIETWLDPAPIHRKGDNVYVERYYNDRMLEPVYCWDYYKPNVSMSVVNINGIGTAYKIIEDGDGGCMGCSSQYPVSPRYNYPVLNVVGKPVVNFTNGKGQKISGITAVDEALSTAADIAELLPEGGFQNFLKTFLKDPVGSIVTLIKGRTYTLGTYALGEIYMRNILGYSQIESRRQVPDSIIIQAETFWTTALGVLIGSNDHLDQLAISPEAYWNWNIDHTNTTFQQVQRAHQILKIIGYPTSNRYSTYPLKAFAQIPYIYPIPTYNPQAYFTGIHPITNESLVNGYPENTTQYPVQLPAGGTPAPGNGAGTNTGSGSGTPAPGSGSGTPAPGSGSGTPAPIQKAGIGTWLGVGILAGGLIYMMNQDSKPKKSRANARRKK